VGLAQRLPVDAGASLPFKLPNALVGAQRRPRNQQS
jgi:hypothetical protein